MEEWDIEFHIDGIARPKQRVTPRKGGKKPFLPDKTREWQHRVAWEAKQAMMLWRMHTGSKDEEMLEGALEVDIRLHHARRESSFFGKFMPGNKRFGDLDNIAKTVLDGMNRVVYKDDIVVARLTVERMWHGRDYVRVRVRRLKD